MKLNIVNILTLLISITNYSQNWEWKQPSAGSNNLYAIAPATQNIWVAAGESGTLFKTTDYGNTWIQVLNSVGDNPIKLITFATSQIGYAVSDFGINSNAIVLKTSDAGSSWTQIAEFSSFLGDRIQFFSADEGYINTSFLMKKTTDGGFTWIDQAHPISGFAFDMHFPSQNVGYAVGDQTVFKTSNGGSTWDNVAILPAISYSIHFINDSTGYIVSSNSIVYKTTNGGSSWDSVLNATPFQVYVVHASPANSNYVAVAGESILFESFNAGSSWNQSIPNPNGSFDYRFHSVRYYDNDFSMVVSNYGNIYKKTINGWVLSQDYKREHIQSVTFIDNQTGFAVDNKGGIHRTTDGGESWIRTQISYFENNYLEKIIFSDSYNGTVFGISDTILTTFNSGNTWHKNHIPNYDYIWDAHFPTQQVGFAVGNNGTILKTVNGGTNWNKITTNINFNIHAVFFLNESIGFIGSIATGLWKTTDGGTLWNQVNNSVGIAAINFPNALTGYAVSGGPSLLKTTDGGNSWQVLSFPVSTTVNSILFTTENIGFAACFGGIIYKTTNGGFDWFSDKSGVGPTDQSINEIKSKPDGYLYAVANRGSFLQSRTEQPTLSPVTLSIMDTSGISGDTVVITVRLRNPSQRLLTSTHIVITNYTSLLTYLSIDTTGTLLGRYHWNINASSTEDAFYLTGGGTPIIDTNDVYFKIKFLARNNVSGQSNVEFFTAQFNYNIIPVITQNGLLIILPRLQTIWQRSSAQNNLPSWFGSDTERGLGYGNTLDSDNNLNSRVFVASRSGSQLNIRILDAQSGNDVGTLNTSGITGGTFSINDVGVTDDGKILVCNLTTNANTTEFKVYMWSNTYSAPVLILSYLADASNAVRLGDKFTVIGNYTNGSAEIWAASSTTGQNKVYRWTMSGGVFNSTPQIIHLSDAITGGVASASVYPMYNGYFYWNANGQNARKYQTNGTLIGIIPSSVIPTGSNAIRYIGSIGSDEFVASFIYGSGNNNAVLVRVPDGIPADAINYSATPSFGSVTNINGTGDIDFKINFNLTVDIFVLATNNGVGMFTTSATIPVELNSFSASVINSDVELKWATSTEINNFGFEIERKNLSQSGWEKIAFIKGAGNSTENNYYNFIDKSLSNGKYSYRLKQIDYNGKYNFSNEIEVELLSVLEFSLYQNYPNPFNPTTTIQYQLPQDAKATLKVYDVLGNEVATLVNEYRVAGRYEIDFDASNLSSGIYFYRIQAGNFIETKKMILLR